MRIFTRQLLLLLSLCMMLGVCSACTAAGQGGANTTESATAAPTTEVTENTDENGFYLDASPEDLKFNRTFRILAWSESKEQFWAEESSTDPMDRAMYNRNLTVEERLGVEFEWEMVAGNWGARNGFLNAMQTASDGGNPHDGIIAYNLVPPVIAVRGYAANLYNTKHLDLTAPWWPSVYLEEMLLNDQIYCLVESNDLGMLRNMMAMFFNNTMLESRNLESPYDLVAKNEWTLDKLAEMIKDTYEDFDNDQKVSSGDIFGCSTATEAKMDAWMYGLGYKLSEVRDGEVVSLLEEPLVNEFIDTMVAFQDTVDLYDYDPNMNWMFLEERVYFYCSAILMTDWIKGNNLEINYGVVPMPKRNSEQDRYYTHLSNTHDAWCVPYNVEDMDCTSAVIECTASESYRQIGPTYYDTYVKLRYAPDERLAEMYDLVRDSVTFDFIYLFSCVYTLNPKDQVKACFRNPASKNWGSTYAQYKNAWDSSFQQIVDTYAVK